MKVGLFVAAVVFAGWALFQQTVQNRLAGEVATKINQVLVPVGATATVADAEFLEGRGLLLRDLAIHQTATSDAKTLGQPLLKVDELLAESHVTLPELVAGDLPLRAVRVDGVQLQVTRNAAGNWNFQSLLNAIANLKPAGQANAPVLLDNCQVIVLDYSGGRHTNLRRIEIPSLSVSVMPVAHEGRSLTQIAGQFTSNVIKTFQFTAWADLVNGQWKLNLNANDIRLSKKLTTLLPNDLAVQLLPLQRLAGSLSVRGSANGDFQLDNVPSFNLVGECYDVVVADQRLPWTLENAGGKLRLTRDGFEIENATGKLGTADFRLSYSQQGWLARQRWHAAGDVQNFHYTGDPRLTAILPGYCGKFCRDFQPEGTSNIRFDMTHDGRELKRTIHGDLRNMSLQFVGMPYRVNRCVGSARIVDRNCEFKIRATEGDQPIDIRGTVANMGHGSTFECQIDVPGGLPLNEKLFTALQKQPKLARVIAAFNPTGFAGGSGVLVRRVAGGRVHKAFDVQLKGVNVRHDKFPYSIRNVGGTIQARDNVYAFKRLTGTNGSARVECNGSWNPQAGLNARLQCINMPLDDQLKIALKPSLREIWHGFRPRGTADQMQVDLRLPIGQEECDVTVEANFERRDENSIVGVTSIYPTWFPYEIRNLTGKVKIGDGQIELSTFQGQHNRTWIKCDGDGRYSNKDWSVRLKDMLVLSLEADDDLLSAIPASLAPHVRNLQYQGKLNASGEMTLAGRYTTAVDPQLRYEIIPPTTAPASTFSLAWDVQLDMSGAKMMVGVPVESVFGAVKLVGQYDGHNAECRGELDIDSMLIYDNQITSVKGPIWLDNQRAAAGMLAEKQPQARTPRRADQTGRSGVAADTSPVGRTPPESLSGKLYGGTVHLDAAIGSGELGEFYVQSTLEDGRLESACQELCPSMKDISGRTFAAFRLAGNCTGSHTYHGDGSVQLRDAKIYELPPVLALLKQLRIGRSDRSAFDSSDVSFTISGETFDLNRIELEGDAISLIGNGRMNMDRKIDLNFYSIMGRNRFNIPLISEMVHAGGQQAMWIRVNGSVDDPQMTRTVLPQLNDSLRHLFNSAGQTGQHRTASLQSHNAAGQRRTR